jgi:c-di-GMP-binding flagellar brake protein YcgR
MFLDTQPARMDGPAGAGADDEFSVTKPAEILIYLQRLIDTRALINLSSPDGRFLTTMLWWVDPVAQDIGFSVDEHQLGLQEVAGAGESVAVTYLENEKLQFPLARMRLKRDPQGLALQCQLPELILRFQRRKSFRVRMPGFDAPTMRFRMPGNPDHVIVGRIIDISIGGCALVVPADTPAFEPGTALPGCRVDLTAEERFVTGFEIRRSAPHQNRQGQTLGTLLGCRWTRLDTASERTLQVYINRRQKHQRADAQRR